VFEFYVDVTAGQSQWVFIYSPDQGQTLATLAVPFGER
jgi:heme/copper-type cytochrome/quinol oxidase subunit 2